MRTSVNMRDELLVRLNEIASGVGYKSWRCMLTGIAKGEVSVVGKRLSVRELLEKYRSPADASQFFKEPTSIPAQPPDWNTPVAEVKP